MNIKINNTVKLVTLPLIALSAQASADYKTDIGYVQLQNALGATISTGAGVKVTQVEASTVPSTDPNYPVFAPDPSAGTMISKTFSYPGLTCGTPPCTSSLYSPHAMGVGNVFYGNITSIAAGITDIHNYEVNQWFDTLFVHGPNGDILRATTSDRRIANHSWVGNGDTTTETGLILRIVDRQVERNEYIQVAAATSSPLLGNAYNTIAVGLTNGTSLGSADVDSTYVAGRARPDLVAPAANVSTATPIVSAAAALLVQTGHDRPELSYGSTTLTGVGTLYNAERSETIKAALMAGADRQTANTSGFGDITNYRSNDHQTVNGLDDRYGAGQVNAYNSYQIIAAGEQDSAEDGGVNNGQIALSGFDYDTAFGGAAGSNATATYAFTADADETLSAALVWNLGVSNNSSMNTTLHHLSLSLRDVTDNTIIASSNSMLDNTQNIYWPELIGRHDYQLQVASLEGAISWDYTLAWNRTINAAPVPVPAAFWLFGSALAGLIGYPRKRNPV